MLESTPVPAGATFFDGGVQAVPRYPSNVYYNVSRQAQQLDEYNHIYVLPPGGACVPIANVTTCRTTPATWTEYVTSENRVMFRHVVDNDPRPHYIHQSNLADYNAALPETHPDQGGIAYPVFGALVDRYEAGFDRASAPLVQLTHTQIGQTLAQQNAWAANRSVTAWLQDGKVHVKNMGTTAADVPVTGTTAGTLYGGQTAGWITIAPGAEQVLAPNDPANTAAPELDGTARVGETLTASKGTWTGTPAVAYDYRWQRCDDAGKRCAAITGATASKYALTAADEGKTVRAVILAGNWISSVSQVPTAVSAVVREAPKSAPSPAAPNGSPPSSPGKATTGRTRLKLTTVKLAPRRFAVSHSKPPKGTRLDGSRLSFKVNVSAKVRLVVQRKRAGAG